MRPHTTKHPSGPAIAATPIPPRIARTRKSSSIDVGSGGFGWFGRLGWRLIDTQRHHVAGQVVPVVVVVGVDRKARRRARPEQADVFGMTADHLGFARAADVPIETDH